MREIRPILPCPTCRQLVMTDESWSWRDGRKKEPEHDRCYAERVEWRRIRRRSAKRPKRATANFLE
jgi:hypothetical protein